MQVDLWKAEPAEQEPGSTAIYARHIARFEADTLKAAKLLAVGTADNFGPGFYCVTNPEPLKRNGDGTVDMKLYLTICIPPPDEGTAQIPLDDLFGDTLTEALASEMVAA
jgi:hypothetical protein